MRHRTCRIIFGDFFGKAAVGHSRQATPYGGGGDEDEMASQAAVTFCAAAEPAQQATANAA
ncbi:MAG: hypothetical protein LBC85_09995 [Fibromonadaceae bacterium]|nr:hypothetical protein [Fibromonadaceae bacterium]